MNSLKMKSNVLNLLALLSATLFAVGCESTPVSAPGDGQIILSANPTTITLDENSTPQVLTGSTLVSAQFFDTNGVPLSGIDVIFSTDGGELDSVPVGQPAQSIESDGNGFVSDTLSVAIGDPDDITVTVRSGTLSGDIAITKFERPANQIPFADIEIDPAGLIEKGTSVLFDGSGSFDPDGDAISCYRWKIETGENIVSPSPIPCTPANPRCEIIQGANAITISRTYAVEQDIDVELRVSDDPLLACPNSGPALLDTDLNGVAAFLQTSVVCDRSNPVANAGPNQIVSLAGGSSVVVSLNGAASVDSNSPIVNYSWSCGNGTSFNSVAGSCTYTSSGTFSATLTVTNDCGLVGQDTAVITVNP